MKFAQEIETAALAALKKEMVGKDFIQEESDGSQTTYRIAEIHEDRYNQVPCLIADCLPLDFTPEEEGDTGKVELVIRIGYLES